jgi:fimbrial chaperone protein
MGFSHFASRVRRTREVLLLSLALVPLAVSAGGFQVAPTIAEVPAGTKVASFQLRNSSDIATTVQIDVLAWDQSETDGDKLTPATGVVVVPRIATMAPHGEQLVRIAVQQAGTGEGAYRLRLREVPPPPPPGFMGVRTLIEQLVPVFFQTDGEAAIAWHARLKPSGDLMIAATNTGPRHLGFSGLKLVDDRGGILAERAGPGYVLAGKTIGWSLDTHARLKRGDALKLEFQSNGKRQEIALTLE